MGSVSTSPDDARWMGAALSLADRGRGLTAPNPNVGCVIVNRGVVVGRGWTQPGGRPHAEAVALTMAGEKSRGATCYVTLEPCAHASRRGPACADLLLLSGVSRVVVAIRDPDPRTDGQGLARLAASGIETRCGICEDEARRVMAGWLTRRARGRPYVTLKLALSLDGCLAMADGRSRWITGPEARAHTHLERSRHEMILVGGRTLAIDAPALDVRLDGLADRSPQRWVLTRDVAPPPDGWRAIRAADDIHTMAGDHLMVEGGAGAAAAFLGADLVDRLLLYRAPILIGGGSTLPDIGLGDLAEAHGRWRLFDARQLGVDRMEAYERA